MAGGLLSKAILTDQEVTAILAPTSTIFPDPASAVPVLKLLHELFQPKVDLSKTYEDLERGKYCLRSKLTTVRGF